MRSFTLKRGWKIWNNNNILGFLHMRTWSVLIGLKVHSNLSIPQFLSFDLVCEPSRHYYEKMLKIWESMKLKICLSKQKKYFWKCIWNIINIKPKTVIFDLIVHCYNSKKNNALRTRHNVVHPPSTNRATFPHFTTFSCDSLCYKCNLTAITNFNPQIRPIMSLRGNSNRKPSK